MDFYQKTVKIDKFEKGTPYVFLSKKKNSKWTNLKIVLPMFFYRNTRKIDKYEKGTGTPYTFCKKTPKIEKFEKCSYPKTVFVSN